MSFQITCMLGKLEIHEQIYTFVCLGCLKRNLRKFDGVQWGGKKYRTIDGVQWGAKEYRTLFYLWF